MVCQEVMGHTEFGRNQNGMTTSQTEWTNKWEVTAFSSRILNDFRIQWSIYYGQYELYSGNDKSSNLKLYLLVLRFHLSL